MSACRAAVIGAGPAGLAAAHTFVQRGWQVDVFERAEVVGGLARSLHLWDQWVDAGPHVLAGGDPDAIALWSSIAGPVRELPLRRALLHDSRFVAYPPTPMGLLRGLGLVNAARIFPAALQARVRGMPAAGSARNWFESRYGAPLYDALLDRYIRKLWGRDGAEIDASYLAAVGNSVGAGRTQEAPQRLLYPVEGLSAAWRRLVDGLAPAGRVLTRRAVDEIVLRDSRVAGVRANGQFHECDAIVSSAPLGALLRMIPGTPRPVMAAAHAMHSRNIVLVHLHVRSATSSGYAWVFVNDMRLKLCRVSDSRFWQSKLPTEDGILTLEYWTDSAEEIWREDDATMCARAERELRETRLLSQLQVLDGHVMRISGALPVPVVGYRAALRPIEQWLETIRGLHVVGRHGTFELDSTLSAMASGIRQARAAIAATGRAPATPRASIPSPDRLRPSVAP